MLGDEGLQVAMRSAPGLVDVAVSRFMLMILREEDVGIEMI